MDQRQETVFSKIWRVMSPLVTYYFVQLLATIGVSAVFAMRAVADMDVQSLTDMQAFYDTLMRVVFSRLLDISFWCTVISGILALPLLVLFHIRDKKRLVLAGKGTEASHTPGFLYPLFFFAGGVAAFAGCCMMLLGGHYRTSGSGETGLTFSQSLPVILIGMGVISPIVEELIFRIVMYDRMKEYLKKPLWAGLISCGIYGFLHQDMTEMVYAFFFGALFAYAYEKTHDWKIPVLAHIAASIVEILFGSTSLFYFIFRSKGMLYGSTGIACLMVVAVFYFSENRLSGGETVHP